MPVVLQPGGPLLYTAFDIITQALVEDGIIAPGETPDGETAQWAFNELQNLVDAWQAMRAFVYAQQFQLFTLTAGLQPHTIGPSTAVPVPNFSTGFQPRPVAIVSAALILNQAPGQVDLPINIRDASWWAAQQVKQIQTNVPTDLYYEPGNVVGSCFFWPVPNAQRQVRLQTWQTLSQYQQINDPLAGPGGAGTLPQGYRAALTYTLAEMLCPGAKIEVSAVTSGKALRCRSAIFGNNDKSPRMSTQDSGMPRTGQRAGVRGDFNWFTGGRPGGPPE